MATNSLTILHLRTFKLGLKPRKLSDGGGLYLLVRPNGSAAWQLAYRFAGKQKTLSFGSYPAVGLQQARKKRDEAKAQLAAKEDPGVLKCIAKLSANGAANNTFRTIGLEWLEKQRKRYRTSHYDRIERRLERDCPPHWKAANCDDRTAYLTGNLTASRKTRWGHVGNAPTSAPDGRPSVSIRHCDRACVARSDRRPERCTGGRAPCPASREATCFVLAQDDIAGARRANRGPVAPGPLSTAEPRHRGKAWGVNVQANVGFTNRRHDGGFRLP
jgi:hypothetical protein